MKILIVIDSLGSGGAQRVQISLALALVERGHKVEFFTYKKEDFFKPVIESNNIKIFLTNKETNGFSISTLKRLRGIILSNNYDAVISSMHAPSTYAALAMFGINRVKLIVCEESSSNAPVNPLRKFLFYLASLLSDSVVTKTFDEAKLLGRWPGLSHKIYPIWNGFKISSFKNFDNISDKKTLRLLVVGRIAYPKNGVNLIMALIIFYDKNGWGPQLDWAGRRDKDSRSIKMQKQMDKLLMDNPQIASNWRWLGEVNEVDKLYKQSDALILVSIYEALPAVIMEAMIEGCFVIASDICDNSLVIGKNERGILCKPLSPESICSAIDQLNALNLNSKKEIIKDAREFAESHFNIIRMVNAYESLLFEEDK